MRYLLILSLFLISCEEGDDRLCCMPDETQTTLTINNQNDVISIREVSLVGYEFEDIKIDYGQARTFTLDNGINGGLTGVNINVKSFIVVLEIGTEVFLKILLKEKFIQLLQL